MFYNIMSNFLQIPNFMQTGLLKRRLLILKHSSKLKLEYAILQIKLRAFPGRDQFDYL